MYEYTVHEDGTRDCLPVGFDLSGYVRYALIGSIWNKYIHISTGKYIDCADYAKEAAAAEAAIKKD